MTLMTESQSSICAWADATFGPPFSDASIVARALREMAELVTACVYGEPAERIGQEIADVVIVLARLGRSCEVDVIALSTPRYAEESKRGPIWFAGEAGAHLNAMLAHGSASAPARRVESAVALLGRLARCIGIDLPAAIDAKMAVNRARRWNVDGRGHGEHVKEES